MEQLYRWVKCKGSNPIGSCFRTLWVNPYDENHTSWLYFNGAINEDGNVYDPDSQIGYINQDTVEWLEPIEESEQNEFRLIKVEFKDHTKIVLTNKHGDTYTSSSEELGDFFH